MKILEYKSADFWRDLACACRSDAAGAKISAAVESVISKVRESGDAALEELTFKFDGARVPAPQMRVSPAEIKGALAAVGSPTRRPYARRSHASRRTTCTLSRKTGALKIRTGPS